MPPDAPWSSEDLPGFESAGLGLPTSDTIRVQVPFKGDAAHWTAFVLQAYTDGHMASYLQSQAATAGAGDSVKLEATNSNSKANTRSIGILLVVCRLSISFPRVVEASVSRQLEASP
jgi:hypothetical protein